MTCDSLNVVELNVNVVKSGVGDLGVGDLGTLFGDADEILIIGIDTPPDNDDDATAADDGLEYEVLIFAISSALFNNFCAFSLISSFFLLSFSSEIYK
jgi:hypothetical protein